jgi:hypothetical protein
MRRVNSEEKCDQVGDFAWKITEGNVRHLVFLIPRSPNNYLFQCLPVRQGPNEAGRCWGWDGNEDAPTLTPSVHTIGHWHGWVRAGELVEA